MNQCREAFEAWSGYEVWNMMTDESIAAWENWQVAWNAAKNSFTRHAQQHVYAKNCSKWIVVDTPNREQLAYSDGHYNGWRDAIIDLTNEGE